MPIGEEASTDCGAVLAGFAVAVEEVELVWVVELRCLWTHCYCYSLGNHVIQNHFHKVYLNKKVNERDNN